MQVLEHDDVRRRELFEERAPDPARLARGGSARRDVEERPERRRRSQVLARPDEHVRAGVCCEGAHERRLPDARLAAEEHEAPAFGAGRVQLLEQILAF